MARSAEIANIAEDTIDVLADPLTVQLRSMAYEAGWPVNIVSALTVDGDEQGKLSVYYPEELSEAIENLEYGDINSLPNPVLRSFFYRINNKVEKTEAQAVGDLMIAVGFA